MDQDFSSFVALQKSVPVAWASGAKQARMVNIGDALSPVVVAAMAGLPVSLARPRGKSTRMAAVGTIGHGQRFGVVHFWGSGLDATRNIATPGEPFRPYDETEYHVHAMRGPFSAAALSAGGVETPEVYGDPVYFLPKIFPCSDVKKTHDLGVILHLSELNAEGSERKGRFEIPLWPGKRLRYSVKPEFKRYAVPPEYEGRVRLIDMWCEPTYAGVRAKLAEIASCRSILSTSLHGLVLADAYRIPNAWFALAGEGLRTLNPMDPATDMDHRMRDLYAGQGLSSVPVFGSDRMQPSAWDAVIGTMTSEVPLREVDASALFDAFPLPKAVSLNDKSWPEPRGLTPNLS